MDSYVDAAQFALLGQIVLAMALGAILGIDREIADKPAGLRTHMLVSGAAALLVGLADVVIQSIGSEVRNSSAIRSDPLRIIEAVITGISFIAAGSIIRGSGRDVGGLTTAASLLIASGLGMCVALSQYALAVGVTAVVFVTLRFLTFIEWRWLKTPPNEQDSPDSPSITDIVDD